MSQEGILSNLAKGLENEQKAMDLCSELLTLVDNEEDKEDLKKIISDEARHIKITENLIKIVKEDYRRV
jgi:rubrerythrin